MELSLRSAARGRDALWRRKLGWAMAMAALLWVAWTLRELWLLYSIGLSLGDLPAAGGQPGLLERGAGQHAPVGLSGAVLSAEADWAAGCGGADAVPVRPLPGPAVCRRALARRCCCCPPCSPWWGAGWLDVVSWAASLGGWDLVIRRKALVWLAVWIVRRGAALWAFPAGVEGGIGHETDHPQIEEELWQNRALAGFSYTFTPGIYGILGANRAGKSTLFGLLTDTLGRQSGQILWDGTDILKLGRRYRTKVGYMPQAQGYYPQMSAREFLCYMGGGQGGAPACAAG